MATTDEQRNIPPQQICWRSPSHYFVGVDLGQAADPTALCIMEAYSQREEPTKPEEFFYDVRHLMRYPLGMSYPAMVTNIGLMLQRPPLSGSKTELVIDETGVGRGRW